MIFPVASRSFLPALMSFFCLCSHVQATPLLALQESDQCGACHNPGRAQRPVLERRCTLDCQGCHVDPSGGGPRNQWGAYYEYDSLSMQNFFQPQDPLKDESRFDLHYDGRLIGRRSEGQSRSFPMNSEFSVRLRPLVTHLHLIWQAGFLGRPESRKIDYHNRELNRFSQKFSLMLDALPLNMYVRAFRGVPVYGLRRPNHSLWIRERTGLGQFAMTDALAVGGTPTVPFLHYSLMNGDPSAEPEDRQKGYSFHGGMRGVSYGWHVNGSLWRTRSRKNEVDMKAVGAGAKLPWVLLMAERNWRLVKPLQLSSAERQTLQSQTSDQHPSSVISEYTLALSGIRGMMPGIVYESLAGDGGVAFRKSFFLDLHPVPFLQFEFWRRYESGQRSLYDSLAVLRFYTSF
ncbi:MAG: hypothetical protein H6618_04370 [Deltaproteobacteria bacterium]|nr:hypothetical protein [Deltaproteobacteria bacterium]